MPIKVGAMDKPLNSSDMALIDNLDEKDRDKLRYFLRLLLQQSKYRRLRQELKSRREEISKGQTLSHEEIWERLDV